jgi:hypothetical protein
VEWVTPDELLDFGRTRNKWTKCLPGERGDLAVAALREAALGESRRGMS